MNQPIIPLIDRSELLDVESPGYLYTGAHSPAMRAVAEAIADGYRAKSLGSAGRDYLAEREFDARCAIAELANSRVERVGFTGDASTAWNSIANGLHWVPGDNFVVNSFEHPAVFASFLRLRDQGLEVRVVQQDEHWDLPAESIVQACDERTVGVGLSHVGYMTGLRHDLDEIGPKLRSAEIPLFLDVSHSLGVTALDLSWAAITVSASYKWTLGPYGVGIVIWNEELAPDFRPGAVGWRSLPDIFTERRFEELNWYPDATRFQIGAPALAEIAGLGAAARILLSIPIERIENHALTLTARARALFESFGLTVITPEEPRRRAGNVAFLHEDGERYAAELASRHGVRMWGGDGRVRASFHVFNGEDDLEALRVALEETPATGSEFKLRQEAINV